MAEHPQFKWASDWALAQTKAKYGSDFIEPPWPLSNPQRLYWVKMHNIAFDVLTYHPS